MKTKLILIIGVLLLVIPIVYSTCTVTFGKENYYKLETVSADMVCTEAAEKSQSYTLTWKNNTGGQTLQTDTGITPNSISQHFYKTYSIPSSFSGIGVNSTLTGTNLEGFDNATVSSTSSNALLITGITIGGKWMGLASSFKANVEDENAKKITGADCHAHVKNNDETTTLIGLYSVSINGEITSHWVLYYDQFAEGTDYIVEIHCYCGLNATTSACIDEDGNIVTNSVGAAAYPFTTNTWITFNQDPLFIVNSSGNYEKSISCSSPVYANDAVIKCTYIATREKGGNKETYFRMKVNGYDSTLIKFNKLMYEGTQETFAKSLSVPTGLIHTNIYTVEVVTCYDGFGLLCDNIATTATFTYNGGKRLKPSEGVASVGSKGGGCEEYADRDKKCYYIDNQGFCIEGCLSNLVCNEEYRCVEPIPAYIEKSIENIKN